MLTTAFVGNNVISVFMTPLFPIKSDLLKLSALIQAIKIQLTG
jgi:hypothetical protein